MILKIQEETLNKYGKLLIHGRGNDRWFDKSFCLVVTKSANIGANVEHSWYVDCIG